MGAVRTTADRLTMAQLRAIQSQRRRLHLDDETYYRALSGYPCASEAPDNASDWPAPGQPCGSCRHLTRHQARRLITRWTIAGAPVGGPYAGHKPPPDAPHTLPTPAQRALIERIRAEVTWRTPDGYTRWLASRTSPLRGRQIRSYQDAEAIIEALKHMRRLTDA